MDPAAFEEPRKSFHLTDKRDLLKIVAGAPGTFNVHR